MERTSKKVNRRNALEMIGAFGALFAVACGATSSSSSSGSSGSSGTTGSSSGSSGATSSSGASGTTPPAECASSASPEETAGPYPDKTGMISNEAFNRSDITEGKTGIPLTMVFNVVNTSASCAAIADASVIVWHCDDAGDYSEYSQPGYDGTGETFLRGYQVTDANGTVTFKTIYPGWYNGRAVHVHVEVYVGGKSVKITQMAFPEATSSDVFETSSYSAHGQSTTSNASDMVFSDSLDEEMATLTGDTTSGFTSTLTIGVAL